MRKIILIFTLLSIIVSLNLISACISFPELESNKCNISLLGSSYIIYEKGNSTVYENNGGKFNNYTDELVIQKILTDHTSGCSYSNSDITELIQYMTNGYSIKEQTDSEYQIFLENAKKQNEKKECGEYYKALAKKGKWTIYISDLKSKDENGNFCPQPNCAGGIIGNILWNDLLPIIKNKTCDISEPLKCDLSCNIDTDCEPNGGCGRCINKDVDLTNNKNIAALCTAQIREGKCACENKKCYFKEDLPVACTMDYNPVCCNVAGTKSTESNRCGCVNAKKGTVLYNGECNDSTMVGNDSDSHGCIGSAGYSWCEEKKKCLRVWEENCSEGCDYSSKNKIYLYKNISTCYVVDYTCKDGAEFTDNCGCGCEIMSNPKIKILPDVASQKARERLGNLGFNVTLKEVPVCQGFDLPCTTKPAYIVSSEKEVKLFWFFNKKAKVTVEVDAETGDIIKINKPWWSFLASNIEVSK